MNIDPIAFSVGPLQVRWYGIIMALSVVMAVIVSRREAERQGFDPDFIYDLVLVGAPLGWLGARIYYVIFNWSYYSGNPAEIFKIWHGGLAIHGGILAALLYGFWYTRRHKMDFWQLADLAAPGFVLAQAIGRWGNFFNQEAYGYETNLPWAMYIDGAYRHPTFLYESLWNMGVFIILMLIRRKEWLVRGDLYLTYLGLYSLGRFWIEGLRTDSLMFGPLRAAQVMSLLMMVVVVVIIWWRHKRFSELK